jgi:hypothetical protein
MLSEIFTSRPGRDGRYHDPAERGEVHWVVGLAVHLAGSSSPRMVGDEACPACQPAATAILSGYDTMPIAPPPNRRATETGRTARH